jgi:hypothetical protein
MLEYEKAVNEAKANPLINKTPEPIQRDAGPRYSIRAENNIIFAIKRKIIQILMRIQKFQNDLRLSAFLKEFYKDENQLMCSPSTAQSELLFLEDILAGKAIESDAKKKMKEHCDDKVRTWLKIAFQNKELDFKHHNENIICILLDIILYKDSQIVNTGFTLLTNYF